jgi:hypothetical protein
MTTATQKYVAPKDITVELPDNLGQMSVYPSASDRIQVHVPLLLIEPYLYEMVGFMAQHGNRWYFMDKAQIGQPGRRPSPKKQEGVLLTIAGYINGRLANDPEFCATLEELRVHEKIQEEERQHRAIHAEYHYLVRNVEHAVDNLRVAQRRMDELQQKYQEQHTAVAEFEREHPEVLITIVE